MSERSRGVVGTMMPDGTRSVAGTVCQPVRRMAGRRRTRKPLRCVPTMAVRTCRVVGTVMTARTRSLVGTVCQTVRRMARRRRPRRPGVSPHHERSIAKVSRDGLPNRPPIKLMRPNADAPAVRPYHGRTIAWLGWNGDDRWDTERGRDGLPNPPPNGLTTPTPKARRLSPTRSVVHEAW